MFTVLVLLLTVGSGTWLDVPFTRQSKDGCGSASIWMVMHYWNRTSTPSVEDIHRSVFSPEAGGVYASVMEDYFKSHGYQTFAYQGNWNDLVDNVAKGRPSIICLESNARGTPLHYVVVAGVDAESDVALINDPADRKLRMIRRRDLERRWAATGFWILMAVPENPTLPETKPATSEFPEPPAEIRTYLENATTAFRGRNYGEARRLASKAAGVAPSDPTTNELLATLYFLNDNTESALHYWNRVEKPRIAEIRIEPLLQVDPVRLDRTLDFAPGEVLREDEYVRSIKLIEGSDAFLNFRLGLEPLTGGTSDLRFNAVDRSGLHVLSWFRGLPFLTIQPEWINIDGQTINATSLIRFDRWKRRASFSLSTPLGSSAASRLSLSGDARDETWQIATEHFVVKRSEWQANFRFISGSRTKWSSAVLATTRNGWGTALRYGGSVQYDLIRRPQSRFKLVGGLRGQAGRWLSAGRFAKLESTLEIDWFPQASGSDWRTSIRVSAGAMSSGQPQDERFSLGQDRDGELLLRGHSATQDGRKGAALLADRYSLINAQVEKSIHDFGLLHFSLVPFIDTALTSRWYFDAGAELQISLASVFRISLSAGRDLRAGHTVVFANTSR